MSASGTILLFAQNAVDLKGYGLASVESVAARDPELLVGTRLVEFPDAEIWVDDLQKRKERGQIPIMDSFTIPPEPTPAGFFEGSVPMTANLNQGIAYVPPPEEPSERQRIAGSLNQGVDYVASEEGPGPDVRLDILSTRYAALLAQQQNIQGNDPGQ